MARESTHQSIICAHKYSHTIMTSRSCFLENIYSTTHATGPLMPYSYNCDRRNRSVIKIVEDRRRTLGQCFPKIAQNFIAFYKDMQLYIMMATLLQRLFEALFSVAPSAITTPYDITQPQTTPIHGITRTAHALHAVFIERQQRWWTHHPM